jgi:hypothetical protein
MQLFMKIVYYICCIVDWNGIIWGDFFGSWLFYCLIIKFYLVYGCFYVIFQMATWDNVFNLES